MNLHALAIGLLLFFPRGGAIAWQSDWEEALARAKSERRVVFLAVNMDGERANDRMAKQVYAEPGIVALAANAICLVASASDHVTGGECSRFGTIACSEHRRVDIAARSSVLKPDADGWVVAPQHVFLDPDGKVILSVPYEIRASELEWCFVRAFRALDPGYSGAPSTSARAPRRLVEGGVYDPAKNTASGSKVPTREEALELIALAKKGTEEAGRMPTIRAILSADEPEAIAFIQSELRRHAGRGIGGDVRAEILRAIGARSPASYWEIAADFLDDGSPILRAEAVVAMEQLAAPGATKELGSLLAKEKAPEIQKDLVRALASCGADDPKVREKIARIAEKEKDPLVRANAIVALGNFPAGDPEIAALLERLLKEGQGEDREAAACAMAFSRDTRWTSLLEAAAAQASDARVRETLKASLSVLRDGKLAPLKEPLDRLTQDKIRRERYFPLGG